MDFWLLLPWIQTETTMLTLRIINDSLGTFCEHQFFSSEKQGNHDNSFGYFCKVTKLFSLLWSYHPAKAQSNILTKQKMQACQSSLKSRILNLDSKILRGWHSNVFLYSGVCPFYFQSFSVSSLRSSYANHCLSPTPVSTFEYAGPPAATPPLFSLPLIIMTAYNWETEKNLNSFIYLETSAYV